MVTLPPSVMEFPFRIKALAPELNVIPLNWSAAVRLLFSVVVEEVAKIRASFATGAVPPQFPAVAQFASVGDATQVLFAAWADEAVSRMPTADSAAVKARLWEGRRRRAVGFFAVMTACRRYLKITGVMLSWGKRAQFRRNLRCERGMG